MILIPFPTVCVKRRGFPFLYLPAERKPIQERKKIFFSSLVWKRVVFWHNFGFFFGRFMFSLKKEEKNEIEFQIF